MSKEKIRRKTKKVSKTKVPNLPTKVKKGQITKKELKAVGYITPDNKLKGSAPIESVSGIGAIKGRILREKYGVDTVEKYRSKSFKEIIEERRAAAKAKPVKKKPKKVKPKITKAEKEIMGKRKYYIIENKTGKVLSVPLDSRAKAKVKEKLFKSDTTVVLSKPENLKKMGAEIRKRTTAKAMLPKEFPEKVDWEAVQKRAGVTVLTRKDFETTEDYLNYKEGLKRVEKERLEMLAERTAKEEREYEKSVARLKVLHEAVKPVSKVEVSEAPFLDERVFEIKDSVKAQDYSQSKEYIRSETDFIHTIDNLENYQMELSSIERDMMGVLKDTEANRKAIARLKRVQKTTKDSIAEWESEKKKFLGKSKSVKAPRKGNEYIIDVLVVETTTKPTPAAWKKEYGKKKNVEREMRKLIVGLYEAEYGKGSVQAREAKALTDDLAAPQLYGNIISYTESYDPEEPFEFPH